MNVEGYVEGDVEGDYPDVSLTCFSIVCVREYCVKKEEVRIRSLTLRENRNQNTSNYLRVIK